MYTYTQLYKLGMTWNYKFKLHSSSKWEHAYQMCECVRVLLLVFLYQYSHFESVQMHELHQAIGEFIWQFVHKASIEIQFLHEKSPTIRAFIETISHIGFHCIVGLIELYDFFSLLLYNFIVTVLLWSPWSLAATDEFIYAFRFIVLHTKRAKHELFM